MNYIVCFLLMWRSLAICNSTVGPEAALAKSHETVQKDIYHSRTEPYHGLAIPCGNGFNLHGQNNGLVQDKSHDDISTDVSLHATTNKDKDSVLPFVQSLDGHKLDTSRTIEIVYRFSCPVATRYSRAFRAKADFDYMTSEVTIDGVLNIATIWSKWQVGEGHIEFGARMAANKCVHFSTGHSCMYKYTGRLEGRVVAGSLLFGEVLRESHMSFSFAQNPLAPASIAPTVTEECHRVDPVHGSMYDFTPETQCNVLRVDVSLVAAP